MIIVCIYYQICNKQATMSRTLFLHTLFKVSVILFVYLLSVCATQSLTYLQVTPQQSMISTSTIYNWQFTLSDTAPTPVTHLTLVFPFCVIIDPNAIITDILNPATLNANSFNQSEPNILTFTLNSSTSSKNFQFNITDVTNCPYVGEFYDIRILVNDDLTQYNYDTYIETSYGEVLNLQVTFEGITGDLSSTAIFQFENQHPVLGDEVVLHLSYSTYKYTSNNNIFDLNSTPTSLLIINTAYESDVVTCEKDFSSSDMECRFSNMTLDSNSQVTFKLFGIRNPLTSTNYISSTGFVIKILDTNGKNYDISTYCTINEVELSSYEAYFLTTSFPINSYTQLPDLKTTLGMRQQIRQNDVIQLSYSSGNLTEDSCSKTNTFEFARNLQKIKFTFYQDDRQYKGNRTNDNYGIIGELDFGTCLFGVPGTTEPVYIQIKFSTTFGTDQYSPYLVLQLTILPLEGTITDVTLLSNQLKINQLATYSASITITNPLSSNSMIYFKFPDDFNLENFDADPNSYCQIYVQHSLVSTKDCSVHPSLTNTVVLEINSLQTLDKGFNIEFSLQNIRNPSHPLTYASFSLQTYYSASNSESLVEKGSGFATIKYEPQLANVNIDSNSFKVSQDVTIGIIYTPQVDLSLGSIIKIQFNQIITNIQYDAVATSSFNAVSSNTTTHSWRFTMNQSLNADIPIYIFFKIQTPSIIGLYPCFNLQTLINSVTYERTTDSIQIVVDQQAQESFTILAETSEAGAQSIYQFTFTEQVPHTIPYFMRITFPSDTDLHNGESTCKQGCTLLVDKSSGGIDIAQITINTAAGSNGVRTIKISGITNRRSVGLSQQFIINTLTQSFEEVSQSTNQVNIAKPSKLTAEFVSVNSYYKSNSEPVQIQFNFFNKLLQTDKVKIQFTSASYTINSAVSCIQAICSSSQDTTGTTIIISPSSSQILNNNITFTIIGLISNSQTAYGQQVLVSASSYAGDEMIDTGTFYYKVSCSDIASKNCKQCAGTDCTSCYDTYSLLENTDKGDICTNNCGDDSKFETFTNSGICEPCIQPCKSCESASVCKSCIINHYFYTNGSCEAFCKTSQGYYISSNGLDCFKCYDQANCLYCTGTAGETCLSCDNGMVAKDGKCTGDCGDGYIVINGQCTKCDQSCYTCDQEIKNCTQCNIGYINVSNSCLSGCPAGTVNIIISADESICSCTGDCEKCVDLSDKCLTCSDTDKFYYNYQCLNSCPFSTYPIGKICYDCNPGCYLCTKTTCMQCESDYFIYDNQCYSDCKTIGPRFISSQTDFKCVECPDGCDDCNQTTFDCYSCIDDPQMDYVLTNDSRCTRQCEIDRTCDLQPEADPIVPLPGTISMLIWAGIVALIWIFFNKAVYVPYALIFIGCLVQFFVVCYTLSQTVTKIAKLETARLLQDTTATSGEYLNSSLIILIVWLAFNFLGNIFHLILFCVYTKHLIPKRQIHKVTNYITLIVATLSSFRFGFLAYARIFPSPYLQIKSPQKLRFIHILSGIFYFGLDILLIVAGIILAFNSPTTPGITTTYLLGIDLILLTICFMVIFIYIICVPKNDEYFQQIKKYVIEEVYKTQQNFNNENENSDKNSVENEKSLSKLANKNSLKRNYSGGNEDSKANLGNDDNFVLKDQDIEVANDDMPTVNPNVLMVVPNKKSYRSEDNYDDISKTERKNKNMKKSVKKSGKQDSYKESSSPKIRNRDSSIFDLGSQEKNQGNDAGEEDPNDASRNNSILEEDLEKIERKKKKISGTVSYQNLIDNKKQQLNKNSMDIKSERNKGKPNHSSHSSLMKNQVNMKKKATIPNYMNSQTGGDQANIDQVDFEAIIQTKMIDRSGIKGQEQGKSKKRNKSEHRFEMEGTDNNEISPSWFNIQNQRYDLEDEDDE